MFSWYFWSFYGKYGIRKPIVYKGHQYGEEIIIIIIITTPLPFFTSVLADGFSLESEWQQVSSSLQDSSQYSGCSQ